MIDWDDLDDGWEPDPHPFTCPRCEQGTDEGGIFSDYLCEWVCEDCYDFDQDDPAGSRYGD